MQVSSNSAARDVGTAIAVLAMYLLMLLAPWHQAAALQHDLADLGYASTATVDICGDLSSGTDDGVTGFKCPMAGIGKFEFTGIAPDAAALHLPRIAHPVTYAFATPAAPPRLVLGARQPRAPPATV